MLASADAAEPSLPRSPGGAQGGVMPGGAALGSCRAQPGIPGGTGQPWEGTQSPGCCPGLPRREGRSSLRCFRGLGCARAVRPSPLGTSRGATAPTWADTTSDLQQKQSAPCPSVCAGVAQMDLASLPSCPEPSSCRGPPAGLAAKFPKSSGGAPAPEHPRSSSGGSAPHG